MATPIHVIKHSNKNSGGKYSKENAIQANYSRKTFIILLQHIKGLGMGRAQKLNQIFLQNFRENN